MNADTGSWPIVAPPRASWLGGLTRRGRPPRDHTARQLRLLRLGLLLVGYALLGAGLLRFVLGGT